LKPIVWNTKGYVVPSGYPSSSGFPHDYGFGHEEWNNNPNRVWKDYRVFHTEAPDRLHNYSSTGELGIITIASFQGTYYAIGVAVNAFHNDQEERLLICEELNIYDAWQEIWSVNHVREKFDHDQVRFLDFWNDDYHWIAWKRPQDL
jgi:hypothetical protein